jgi:hypothetical protein
MGANRTGFATGRLASRGAGMLDLYRDMGQIGEFGQSLPVMRRLARA